MRSLCHCLIFAVVSSRGVWAGVPTPVSGPQSGTWTLANSPYHLVGDVTVPMNQTLIIEPGVEIIAQGYYRITIEQDAILRAVGTVEDPVHFTSINPSTGWRGLRFIKSHDDSLLSHCIVEYGRGTGGALEVQGGNIYIRECSPRVANCIIRYGSSSNQNANGRGGGICLETSMAIIEDNQIVHNTSNSGGGVFAGIATGNFSSPIIRRNYIAHNFASNAGGGIYMGSGSSPLIDRNIIVRNHGGGWGGGGINSWTLQIWAPHAFPTIINNLIALNTATNGGGLYLRYDLAIMVNNTIAYNSASGAGGGVYALNYPEQAPALTNHVIWGNTAAVDEAVHLYPDTNSAIWISHSIVQGGYPGTANTADDPQFIQTPGPKSDGDFRLSAGSPAIDFGSNSALLPGMNTDLAGNPRIVNQIVDRGAYEFIPMVIGDITGDGVVNVNDLLAVINAWGPCPPPPASCPADIAPHPNGDGVVNVNDLLLVINHWG